MHTDYCTVIDTLLKHLKPLREKIYIFFLYSGFCSRWSLVTYIQLMDYLHEYILCFAWTRQNSRSQQMIITLENCFHTGWRWGFLAIMYAFFPLALRQRFIRIHFCKEEKPRLRVWLNFLLKLATSSICVKSAALYNF